MGKRGRKPTQPCGTVAAYKRHGRAGEPPCDPCRAAWAAKQRRLYAKRKLQRIASEWSEVAM